MAERKGEQRKKERQEQRNFKVPGDNGNAKRTSSRSKAKGLYSRGPLLAWVEKLVGNTNASCTTSTCYPTYPLGNIA